MREILFEGSGYQLPLIESAVIPRGFRHGFTTRRGGVSRPPYDSFNLGGKWGDDAALVAENRRRFRAAAGDRDVHFATQVHGHAVARVSASDPVERTGALRADAVATAVPGTAVGVYVADCVPILLADTRTGACAAVHAGWRGTVAGVLAEAIRHLTVELGARPADLRVAIGPSIGPCCFEVGPEVVDAVEAAFPAARAADAILTHKPKAHVDLWTLNRLTARELGVAADAIDVAGLCTACDRERFFSYRRDHGQTGQLAAFIVSEGPA
ncbi:MAG TPA: peptidoglycan editing factor PgeF [Polyangia bacterium]|nr:peptidoglycan editing factor PgeF [Polyangia bacterium]